MVTLWEIKPLLATLHHSLQLLPFVYSEKVFYDTQSRQLQLMIYDAVFLSHAPMVRKGLRGGEGARASSAVKCKVRNY